MKILAYICTEWAAFVGTLEKLVGYHQATGTLPAIPDPPAAGIPAGASATGTTSSATPTTAGFPAGVTIADPVNGLVFIDPSASGNPDTAGQMFACLPALAAFDAKSQAAYTISQNVEDEAGAERGLGIHPRVRPMVATPNERNPFVYAPMIIGETMDRVPYLDKAWSITGDTWPAVLANLKPGHWQLPTNNGPGTGAGHVPGAR